MNFKQPPSLPWAKIHSSSVQEHQWRSCHLLFVLRLHASHSVDKWQNGSHKYEPTARGAIFYVGNKSALPRVVLGEKIPSPMKVCLGELSSATFKMQPGFDSRRGGDGGRPWSESSLNSSLINHTWWEETEQRQKPFSAGEHARLERNHFLDVAAEWRGSNIDQYWRMTHLLASATLFFLTHTHTRTHTRLHGQFQRVAVCAPRADLFVRSHHRPAAWLISVCS